MLGQLHGEFQRHFGRAPQLGVRAPGRVNLIGEHTDYNDGLVLPCAIDRDTLVLAAAREDQEVHAFSLDMDRAGSFDASAPERRGDWLDYVMAPVFGPGTSRASSRVVARTPSSAIPRDLAAFLTRSMEPSGPG